MDTYTTWKRFGPLGLVTVGLGLSMLGATAERKIAGQSWFWRGTLSLSVVNAGLALFGESVKARALFEWTQARSAGPSGLAGSK